MNLDIFESTRNWQFSPLCEKAQAKMSRIENEVRSNAPPQIYGKYALLHMKQIRDNELYKVLKTLPKGVLHNVYLNSCEDADFYRECVVNDPNIYTTRDWNGFRIGTAKDAETFSWLSMVDARKDYPEEESFIKAITQITTFTSEELKSVIDKSREVWEIFVQKMKSLQGLISAIHIFRKYVSHMLRKFIKNGYCRVEIRAQIVHLIEYDDKGNISKRHSESKWMEVFTEEYIKIREEFPYFTVGIIFYALKSAPLQETQLYFTRICEHNYPLTIGFDFVQEEDLYSNLSIYDAVLNKVLAKYPDRGYKKVYHAGQTNSFLSHNIQIAVKADAVRIGHGLNILQRAEFLSHCNHICFEKCPISNLILGYSGDSRQSSSPILLGLGYAVSINPGDSGKFGCIDSTQDYFISAISYNWTLKHLKLVAYHSLNHAISGQKQRRRMIKWFESEWQKWATNFVNGYSTIQKYVPLDIFTSTRNWQWTNEDEVAEQYMEILRHKSIAELPQNFYYIHTLTHLEHIRSSELYEHLKTIPKGVLHHLHFDCTEDEDFYRQHIVTHPNVYLNADKNEFMIGTKEDAERENWVTFSKFREEFPNERKFIKFISNITMLSKQELMIVSTVQKDLWQLFEHKIGSFNILLSALDIFKNYVRHVLRKYIRNGYDRVQFRALLIELTEYTKQGKILKVHDKGKFMEAFDEVYNEVKKDNPKFSSGFIFFGLKALTEEQNFEILDKACSYGWKHMIGIDFVQQQDPYGSMEPYIRVGDAIVKKYNNYQIKKVYHAGQTKDHLNNNVQLAVRSGSVRIGHGLNIVKRIDYLPFCRHICFELNPISNLLTGGMLDIRMSTAPLLLALGYAVSISPDDPGKFGYEDVTVDYFCSAVSFNWTLKHLKLIAFHSINHAICTEGHRINLVDSFNERWNEWIRIFNEKMKGQLQLVESIAYPKRARDPNNEIEEEQIMGKLGIKRLESL